MTKVTYFEYFSNLRLYGVDTGEETEYVAWIRRLNVCVTSGTNSIIKLGPILN